MIKKLSILAAGSVLAMSAQAAFINGAVSFIGSFQNLPGAGSPVVVGAVPPADLDPSALAVSANGNFVNGPATAFDFLPPPTPFTLFTSGGFTFTVTVVEGIVAQTPLDCVSNNGSFLCDDSVLIDFRGIVSGNGFEPTAWNGNFSAQGTCTSGDGILCSGPSSASWSSSIVSTGRADIPEPGMLALVGLGLAGVAFSRRRKA